MTVQTIPMVGEFPSVTEPEVGPNRAHDSGVGLNAVGGCFANNTNGVHGTNITRECLRLRMVFPYLCGWGSAI